jgi:hypothetical protein
MGSFRRPAAAVPSSLLFIITTVERHNGARDRKNALRQGASGIQNGVPVIFIMAQELLPIV